MADAEAKREARRRKILENSEKRLKKITGVESRVTRNELEDIKFKPSGEKFNLQKIGIPNLENCTRIESDGDTLSCEYNAVENDLETIFQNPRISSDEDSISQISGAQQSIPRHFYIMILSLIINILLVLADVFHIDSSQIYLNKIFLPLIAFEIYDYIFTPNVHFSSSLISSVILLSNRQYSKKLNSIVRYFSRTVQDIMLYFFVFLISNCIKIMFV